jgi:hypothetical protein
MPQALSSRKIHAVSCSAMRRGRYHAGAIREPLVCRLCTLNEQGIPAARGHGHPSPPTPYLAQPLVVTTGVLPTGYLPTGLFPMGYLPIGAEETTGWGCGRSAATAVPIRAKRAVLATTHFNIGISRSEWT